MDDRVVVCSDLRVHLYVEIFIYVCVILMK